MHQTAYCTIFKKFSLWDGSTVYIKYLTTSLGQLNISCSGTTWQLRGYKSYKGYINMYHKENKVLIHFLIFKTFLEIF